MDFIALFSNGCIISTIIMFATGIPQCIQIVKQKKTGNIPFLPYLMTNANNVSWIIYGLLSNNFTVIFVNVIGACLQSIYMAIHTFYADNKRKQLIQSTTAFVMIYVGNYIIKNMFEDSAMSLTVAGFVCCIITILMFASPLAQISNVIAERSTATISFPLTVASFVCAGMWTLFGLVIRDNFIVVPNILGVLTSVARFLLFAKFPTQPLILPK